MQVKFCSDPVRSEDYFPEWKPALIDVILTTEPVNIIKVCSFISGLSDHDMVIVRLLLNYLNMVLSEMRRNG